MNPYLRGIGIGLAISWVTAAIANYVVITRGGVGNLGINVQTPIIYPPLFYLEVIVSIIALILSAVL